VFLYVGRIAAEKNIAAFLDLDLPGRKVVVGGGPQLDELSARYPDVLFTGKKTGEALAECYASADAFVFPSTTDTFGMVLLEAMASGLPIAALPVCGPQDVVTDGVTGFLSHDLRAAALAALDLDRSRVRARAAEYSWENAARLFLANITGACLNGPARAQSARKLPLAKTSRPPQARI
jgi:glycosyltransferase involved in cell wall biosynthesis